MKKNNIYLSVMIGFFILISGLITVILGKFMPFFANETIYMCKNMVAAVSVQKVPHYLSNIVLYGAMIYGVFVICKLAAAVYQYKTMTRRYSSARKRRDTKIDMLKVKYPFLPEIYVVASRESRAFSLGFVRRSIYISSQLVEKMSDKELEAVILHEYKHVKDFDSLKLFIAFVIETALSFIPSMKEFTISMRIDREIEADGFAVHIQKTNTHLLSSLEKFLRSNDVHQPHFVPRFAPGDLLDARVSSLLQHSGAYKKQYSLPRLAVSMLSLCTIAYLALTPVHATEMLIDGKTSVMACTETSPQCLAICETGASHLSKQR
jgi:beta-lactamase regulating signal transducer with metallopeptidase domain